MSTEETPKVGSQKVELLGTSMEFLELDREKYPLGVRVDFTRPGELAPFRTGFMTPGSALLYMQPEVAQQFKAVAQASPGGS